MKHRHAFYKALMDSVKEFISLPSEQGMFWKVSLKVMNKGSPSNVKRTLIQSYLFLNNVLKTFVQKHYLYIVHGVFLHVTTCLRTFREHSMFAE